ncbi:unnamed protein product [Owenia fusiformis]|uniref:Uncharacterized protein n=1 Tax=Owenia fusiformis TaxID=6347 RepID=A0A8S4N2L8_OWEFU|nr:unnamed protein product [Owenia fusiformis]
MKTLSLLNLTWMILSWSSELYGLTFDSKKCFACTYVQTNDPTATYECVADPENVKQGQPIVTCSFPDKAYCIIKRQMFISTGKLRSFSRGCDNVDRGNKCTRDHYFYTCYTTCTEDGCNGDTGITGDWGKGSGGKKSKYLPDIGSAPRIYDKRYMDKKKKSNGELSSKSQIHSGDKYSKKNELNGRSNGPQNSRKSGSCKNGISSFVVTVLFCLYTIL